METAILGVLVLDVTSWSLLEIERRYDGVGAVGREFFFNRNIQYICLEHGSCMNNGPRPLSSRGYFQS